jgi:ketosteroid isomerase-like protein
MSGTEDPDVAFVLEAFRAFDLCEGSLEDYFARFYAPDGMLEFVDGFPVPGRYEGIEGFKRWYADSYGPYDGVERQLVSITKEGDRVVVLLTITGRPKGEDVDLELQVGNTYELADGRITHLRVYLGHRRAVEAARDGG